MKLYIRLALATAILAGAVNYAQLNSGVACTIQNSTPTIVRVEGTTELIGDIILACTGGIPTASGQPIPVTNVTLTLNTNVTSRLLGGNYLDALLTIDEPYPSNPIVTSGTVTAPANQPAQSLCYASGTATPGSCNYLLGTGGGGYQTPNNPYLQSNASTIYAGQQSAANQVTWIGVPIDPPGSNGATRYIRLTNLRADAAQVGLSPTMIPNQVVGFLAINPSENIAINNPQAALAYIQSGLVAPNTSLTLCGCPSHNAYLLSGGGNGSFDGAVQITEGSAVAFKRRNVGLTTNGTTAPATYPQNIPGSPYETETGFLPSPSTVSPPNYALSPADSGTRILLVFDNVPFGVHVFLPVSVELANGNPGPGYPSGNPFHTSQLQLIQAESNGYSGQAYTSLTSTAAIGTTPVAEASRIGHTAYAVYEVVDSDPTVVETASIPIALAFSGSTNQVGTVIVGALLAPISDAAFANTDSLPVPRFFPFNPTVNFGGAIAGDFDGNGVSDRVWENDTTGQATVHYAGYAGVDLQTWNWLNTTDVPTWHIVAVADFSASGFQDLVWQDSVTREVTIHTYGYYPISRSVVLQSWSWAQATPVPGWTVVGAADFNGDGVPDLVWQNDTTRQVTVHYYGFNGTSALYLGWNWLQKTSIPGWHVVGAGDFNRDGVPDLVWQNDTTGQVILHYYGGPGGAVYENWAPLNNNAAAPAGWTIKAVSDVNGDGVPDLLWQNTTTHQVTVNYYGGAGGASIIGWNWISEAGVPGWSIVH
ncbi:MAG: VCBS repeat-containing protein [Bryobacteraceae bacterium]|jgi:hypothetical protein